MKSPAKLGNKDWQNFSCAYTSFSRQDRGSKTASFQSSVLKRRSFKTGWYFHYISYGHWTLWVEYKTRFCALTFKCNFQVEMPALNLLIFRLAQNGKPSIYLESLGLVYQTFCDQKRLSWMLCSLCSMGRCVWCIYMGKGHDCLAAWKVKFRLATIVEQRRYLKLHCRMVKLSCPFNV